MVRRIAYILLLLTLSTPLIYSQKNQLGLSLSYLNAKGSGTSLRMSYSYFINRQFFVQPNVAVGLVSDKNSYMFNDFEIDAGFRTIHKEKFELRLSIGLSYYMFLSQGQAGNAPIFFEEGEIIALTGKERKNCFGINFKMGTIIYPTKSLGIKLESVIANLYTEEKYTYIGKESNSRSIVLNHVSLGIGVVFNL